MKRMRGEAHPAVIVVVIVLAIALSVGGWFLKRWWNYAWSYESQVTETVCEMVKPEALRDPGRCK